LTAVQSFGSQLAFCDGAAAGALKRLLALAATQHGVDRASRLRRLVAVAVAAPHATFAAAA
jgi:hypothetical protein